MSMVYDDKMIVFDASARMALKAKEEIDTQTGTSLDVHDTVVVVKFWPAWQSRKHEKGIDDAFKNTKEILEKYGLDYRIKKWTF